MKKNQIGLYLEQAHISKARKASIIGKYEVEIPYYFFFNKFTHWDLEYPLNVYQDQIDDLWIPRPQEMYKQQFDIRVNPESGAANAISDNRSSQSPYFLKLPDYDPWVMPMQSWVKPVVQVRLVVENVENQELFNVFTDIPGFTWDEHVKRYMLRRREVVFEKFQTPFLIQIYSDELLVQPKDLAMDENGSVRLLRAPEMKNTYRAVVTLDYAIRDYARAVWDDLSLNPEDWALIVNLFPWYKWDDLPEPWAGSVKQILKGLNFGRGRVPDGGTPYMMDLGLNAYNSYTLLRNTRNGR